MKDGATSSYLTALSNSSTVTARGGTPVCETCTRQLPGKSNRAGLTTSGLKDPKEEDPVTESEALACAMSYISAQACLSVVFSPNPNQCYVTILKTIVLQRCFKHSYEGAKSEKVSL